jgi:medium-chain acyl-[acyl-carrier-protein] hydrolase
MSTTAASLRLYCFPYAGARGNIFGRWASQLAADVEICPIVLPGRGVRRGSPSFKRLAPLVEKLGEDLEPELDHPFAFFGHSLGALIAFEMARYLRREECPEPAQLFVSGCRPPHYPNDRAATYDLPDADLQRELVRLNGTPPQIFEIPELLQYVLPIVRADFEVIQTYAYTPQAPLSCPITVLGGLGDRDVPVDALDGWREHTSCGCTQHLFDGDHFFLHSAESAVLALLSRECERMTREHWLRPGATPA